MPRLPRTVIPGLPHHVVQRGNRRQRVFFRESDRTRYLELLAIHGRRFGLQFWAFCLMDNHVHLIVVPRHEHSLARGLGEAHRKYTCEVNWREGWSGYLWQGRFFSCGLSPSHLIPAIRYVELNPVRAGMVARAEDYRWSSAKHHVNRRLHPLLTRHPLFDEIPNWREFLSTQTTGEECEDIRRHSRTGRPLGSDEFLLKLEAKVGKRLRPLPRGRKPGSGGQQPLPAPSG